MKINKRIGTLFRKLRVHTYVVIGKEKENVDYHIILKPLKELLLIQAKTR